MKFTQQLVQVARNLVPILSGLIAGQRDKEALGCDNVDFVDGFEDQIEDAFLLEKILSVSQRTQFVLFFLVF